MNRLSSVLVVGAMLSSAVCHAQISCTRDGLQAAADLYVAAQSKGDTTGLPLAPGLAYIENFKMVNIQDGLLRKPMAIDHHRSLLDTATCQTFTEVIVTDKSSPYVLGARLRVNHGLIAEIEILWTTTGYWLFNADNYLKYSSSEDWSVIPAGKRDTRATLVAAAGAYLDAFLEKKMDLVPWGYPCHRTEGGMRTGKGLPTDTCEEGVPSGVNITNRHYVVDETIGAVVAFCTFGAGSPDGVGGAPDTHLFRLNGGKIRYVHTLTHLLQADFRRPQEGAATNSGAGAKAPEGR
jgi:hypothetical protein